MRAARASRWSGPEGPSLWAGRGLSLLWWSRETRLGGPGMGVQSCRCSRRTTGQSWEPLEKVSAQHESSWKQCNGCGVTQDPSGPLMISKLSASFQEQLTFHLCEATPASSQGLAPPPCSLGSVSRPASDLGLGACTPGVLACSLIHTETISMPSP